MTNYANSCAGMVHRDIVRSIDNRCAYLSTISANTSARMLDRVSSWFTSISNVRARPVKRQVYRQIL